MESRLVRDILNIFHKEKFSVDEAKEFFKGYDIDIESEESFIPIEGRKVFDYDIHFTNLQSNFEKRKNYANEYFTSVLSGNYHIRGRHNKKFRKDYRFEIEMASKKNKLQSPHQKYSIKVKQF